MLQHPSGIHLPSNPPNILHSVLMHLYLGLWPGLPCSEVLDLHLQKGIEPKSDTVADGKSCLSPLWVTSQPAPCSFGKCHPASPWPNTHVLLPSTIHLFNFSSFLASHHSDFLGVERRVIDCLFMSCHEAVNRGKRQMQPYPGKEKS